MGSVASNNQEYEEIRHDILEDIRMFSEEVAKYQEMADTYEKAVKTNTVSTTIPEDELVDYQMAGVYLGQAKSLLKNSRNQLKAL